MRRSFPSSCHPGMSRTGTWVRGIRVVAEQSAWLGSKLSLHLSKPSPLHTVTMHCDVTSLQGSFHSKLLQTL